MEDLIKGADKEEHGVQSGMTLSLEPIVLVELGCATSLTSSLTQKFSCPLGFYGGFLGHW